MKIVIFYNSAWYIYNFRRNLIRELQQAGHTVYAVSPPDEYIPHLENLGVKHHSLKMDPLNTNPFREIVVIFNLWRLLRSIGPDLVLSFTIKCNLYAGLCSAFLRFKQIANISGLGQVFDSRGTLNRIVCLLYRAALKKTHCIFFQNIEDLQICLKRRLVKKQNCHLLPGSGVDLSHFSPCEALNPTRRVFLMFGRMLPKKGYGLFLAAAKKLKEQYGDRVEFQIMGVADNSRADSRSLYAEAQLAHRGGWVKLLPRTDDVRPILQAVDVVVLPSSYNEGVPRSLLEAMACGKPIITTHWKGCRETVVEGVNGSLIPVGDGEALTAALQRMIDIDSRTLLEMGQQSRQIAESRFDERLVISQYMQQSANGAR